MKNNISLNKALLVCLLFLVLYVHLAFLDKRIEPRLNSDTAHYWIIKIRKAEKTFKEAKSRYGSLDELTSIGLIEQELTNEIRHGYRYKLLASNHSYKATATPLEYQKTGLYSFYVDHSGTIRVNTENGSEAMENDEAIGNQSDQFGD